MQYQKRVCFVDVDGVLANLGDAWMDAYNKDYDDTLTDDMLTDWNVLKFVKPECGEKIFDYLHDPELYNNVQVIDGANAGVSFIRQSGFRVVFATSSVNGSAGRKYRWLIDNGFIDFRNHPKDYIEIQDKSLLIGNDNVLIDDGFHNVNAFTGFGILFRAPHNLKEQWHTVLYGWEDIYRILRSD